MDKLIESNLSLSDMILNLLEIDDETWGEYAFSRDILKDRVPYSKMCEMISKSIQCGEEYAKRIIEETGQSEPIEIARQLGLQVTFSDLAMTGKRVLFAQFTPPDHIEISKEPVKKYKTILAENTEKEFVSLFSESSIYNILLGHEIFHFLEDRYEDEIYTRTEKIQLWHILNFRNNSTIRAIGEIAGMAFSKKLNRTTYSPFLLDVLLFFEYNPEGAKSIYRDIMQIAKQKKQ